MTASVWQDPTRMSLAEEGALAVTFALLAMARVKMASQSVLLRDHILGKLGMVDSRPSQQDK